MMTEQKLLAAGLRRIEDPVHSNPMVPLRPWADYPLRFTLEQLVMDFPLEVSFWSKTSGCGS